MYYLCGVSGVLHVVHMRNTGVCPTCIIYVFLQYITCVEYTPVLHV